MATGAKAEKAWRQRKKMTGEEDAELRREKNKARGKRRKIAKAKARGQATRLEGTKLN